MELFKKFGFWAGVSFFVMLIVYSLMVLDIVEMSSSNFGSIFILNFLSIVLSIIGLIRKEGSKTLSIIFLILPILILSMLVVGLRSLSPPNTMSSCEAVGGQCISAADCTNLEGQYGGNWSHNYAKDGKAGGCQIGEICCVKRAD
jgi:hypothetical protein